MRHFRVQQQYAKRLTLHHLEFGILEKGGILHFEGVKATTWRFNLVDVHLFLAFRLNFRVFH
jgi:hypothetical protein